MIRKATDFNIDATEGIAVIRDDEYVCICPICGADADVDDFETVYYCQECENSVIFPAPTESPNNNG